MGVVFVAQFLGLCVSFVTQIKGARVSECAPNFAGNYFVGDTEDRCVYYWCVNGAFLEDGKAFPCPGGVGVPANFTSGDNPCQDHNSMCADPKADGGANSPNSSTSSSDTTTGFPDAPTTTAGPASHHTTTGFEDNSSRSQHTTTGFEDNSQSQGATTASGVSSGTTGFSNEGAGGAGGSGGAAAAQNSDDDLQSGVSNVFPNFLVSTEGYQVFLGFHLKNGYRVYNVKEVMECVQLCAILPSLCVAVDFDIRTNSCFIHSKQTECSQPLVQKVFCFHVRLQPAVCQAK